MDRENMHSNHFLDSVKKNFTTSSTMRNQKRVAQKIRGGESNLSWSAANKYEKSCTVLY